MIVLTDELLECDLPEKVIPDRLKFTQGILTQDTLSWVDNNTKKHLLLNDIVSISVADYNLFPYLIIRSYPLKKNLWGQQRRILQSNYFVCPTVEVSNRWLNSLKTVVNLPSGRHFHIFLNPASGKKKTYAILAKIKSLLEISNVSWTLTETTQENTIKKITKKINLKKIDGFIIIGGDGTVYQVINGLMNRKKWKKAIKIPIGIIPGGTGNGLAKTILEISGEPYDAISAAFVIVKGQTTSLDLGIIQQNNRQYYSILSISYGMVSEVDIESEKLRFLGSIRNTIYALFRILFIRYYPAKVAFLSAQENVEEDRREETEDRKKLSAGNSVLPDKNLLNTDPVGVLNPKVGEAKLFASHLATQPSVSPPNEEQKWQVIEDDFILFWAMKVSWATHDLKVAPLASFNDGLIDILIVRKGISRLKLLLAFLKCADGSHINLPEVEYYQAKELYLEPLEKQGYLVVDGERFNHSPIQMSVSQNTVNLLIEKRHIVTD